MLHLSLDVKIQLHNIDFMVSEYTSSHMKNSNWLELLFIFFYHLFKTRVRIFMFLECGCTCLLFAGHWRGCFCRYTVWSWIVLSGLFPSTSPRFSHLPSDTRRDRGEFSLLTSCWLVWINRLFPPFPRPNAIRASRRVPPPKAFISLLSARGTQV